ncbi:MAG: hypothetical protein ABSC41_05050 [Acidimicrobiales bacterium]
MSEEIDVAWRRARRLLRWYPKSWQARYGDEFAELLIAEIIEHPRCRRRTANVILSGSRARLAQAGLSGRTLRPAEQLQVGLVSLGCALAAFLTFGVAMWSQLTIGWQWSRPDNVGTTMAVVMMSAAMLLFVSLALLAAIPIAWHVFRRVVCRQIGGLTRPSFLFLAGTWFVTVGARHFGNGWPGTGGHPWFGQGLVPGGVAAFTWASTLFVSSYWAHPGALLSFPVAEVAWMAVSPVAVICLVVGAAKTVGRLDLSPRVLRYEAWLGGMATVGMLIFLVGSCCWLVDGGPGPRNLFHAGAIDLAGLVVMASSLAVAHRATYRSARVRPDLPTS